MIYENQKKMFKQHQLDIKLYLPKLQKDYGIGYWISKQRGQIPHRL